MRRLSIEIPYGKLYDVGLEHYGEFLVHPDYADELLAGGMIKVDGRTGRLIVIDTFENAVQLRWVFDVRADAPALPQLRAVGE